MRLISFKQADGLHIGAINEKGVLDLSLVDETAPTDLGAVVKGGKLAAITKTIRVAGDKAHHQIKDLKLV